MRTDFFLAFHEVFFASILLTDNAPMWLFSKRGVLSRAVWWGSRNSEQIGDCYAATGKRSLTILTGAITFLRLPLALLT